MCSSVTASPNDGAPAREYEVAFFLDKPEATLELVVHCTIMSSTEEAALPGLEVGSAYLAAMNKPGQLPDRFQVVNLGEEPRVVKRASTSYDENVAFQGDVRFGHYILPGRL